MQFRELQWNLYKATNTFYDLTNKHNFVFIWHMYGYILIVRVAT